jgi:hypothetical protein
MIEVECLKYLLFAEPVKYAFRSILKSRRFGMVPSTALSIDTDFEPAPEVNVLSATLAMKRAFTFSRILA